jgi:peptide/nickel transport system permease protein
VIAFALRRLLQAIPTLLGVSLITFVLLKVAPGDPARILAGKNATPAFLAAERHRLYLDRPYPVQYLHFIAGFWPPWSMHFGDSWEVQRYTPVTTVIAQKVPRTAALAISSILIEVIGGIGIGVLLAQLNRRKADSVLTVFLLGVYSLPLFVIGSVGALIFALPHPDFLGSGIGWDFSGWFNYSTQNPSSFLDAFAPGFWIRNLLWPSLTLALLGVASTALVTRTSMLDVLQADYMVTARAKGLPTATLIGKHALKNAVLPVITLVGLDFAGLLGGVAITESIWNWDGLGRLAVQAVNARDVPVVLVLTMLGAAVYVAVNTAVDILYAIADPRIRLVDAD